MTIHLVIDTGIRQFVAQCVSRTWLNKLSTQHAPSGTRTFRPPLSIIGRRMTKLRYTAPLACTRWLIQLVHNFFQTHKRTCANTKQRTSIECYEIEFQPIACSTYVERERERERNYAVFRAVLFGGVSYTRFPKANAVYYVARMKLDGGRVSVYTLDQRQFRPRFIGH